MAVNMAWLAAHKGVAAAAAGAVGLGLYSRHKSAAAAAGTATPVSTAGPVGAATSSTYDSTSQDLYNSLEPQLETLRAQIAGQTPPATTPAALAAQRMVGAGYQPTSGSTVNGSDGSVYTLTPGHDNQATGLDAAVASGQNVYYQSTPGQFALANPGMIKRFGTPGDPWASTATYLQGGPIAGGPVGATI